MKTRFFRNACFCVSILLFLLAPACSKSQSTGNEGNGQDAGEQNTSKEPQTTPDSGPNDSASGENTPEQSAEVPPEGQSKPFTFPGELVPCKTNQSFEALKPILQGGKNNPTGRGEQGAAYDPCNGRVIQFGGNDYQPEQCADFGPKRFKDDTWAYVLEYKNWIRLKTDTTPPARGRQAVAFDPSRKLIYMFGGRYRPENNSGNYVLFNDMWAFDVNTDTWKELKIGGEVPSPRSNAKMVYDPTNDRLILFGGNASANGLQFITLSDTYILPLKDQKWYRVSAGGAIPRSRVFHSMVVDTHSQQVIMVGGGGNNAFVGPFYNDVWGLSLKTLKWTELWKKTATNSGPDARINTVLVADPDNKQIIMVGGHDDTAIGHRNDMWVFDTNQNTWQLKKIGDTGTGSGCASFCRCNPDFVEVDLNSPERRQYHTFVAATGKKFGILFGGKTDCGYIDDTWYLDFTTFKWEEINAASQGEACKRTGRENCKELCY